MSSLQNTLLNTFDRINDIRYTQIMQLHVVAFHSRIFKERKVCLTTQRAFESEAFVLCDTSFDFAQQDSSTFERDLRRSEGESPLAISSAFRKRTSAARFRRNSVANVVFPAPLQPAMR